MDMKRIVGQNVQRYRRSAGLTQEQLSELTGFGQNYLSGLERGQRNPTVVTLFEISQALNVTPADLVSPIN